MENNELAEGIYFNMPFKEYLALPYFSRSAAEYHLLDETGLERWYNSDYNPEKPEREETPAMRLGTATHAAILEPIRFANDYRVAPTKADYFQYEILDKNDELKDFLKSVGEKATGVKADLIARATPYIDPETHIIWDNLLAAFKANVEQKEQIVINSEEMRQLQGMQEQAFSYPAIKKAFSEGHAEVVVIWVDKISGIKCKCLIDWLRPEAIGEVKTFSLRNKKSIWDTMCGDINYSFYNFQYYIYQSGLAAVINKIRSGKAKVHGLDDKEWIAKLLENKHKQYFMLFMRSQAPHQCKLLELVKALAKGATANVYHSNAEIMWQRALQIEHKLRAGDYKRPVDDKPVETLCDEHIPGIMYQSSNY